MCDDRFGNTAHQQVCQASATVCRYDDGIRRVLVDGFDDASRCPAMAHRRLDGYDGTEVLGNSGDVLLGLVDCLRLIVLHGRTVQGGWPRCGGYSNQDDFGSVRFG
jgi:hypothetical protein